MKIRTLNDVMTPLSPETLPAWEAQRSAVLANLRLSSGIDLLRHDAPLSPVVFGAFEFMGIVIEKVIFQSLPGFYVTGNLFRPRDVTKKYPAVLNPHGHWDNGRLEMSPLAFIPGRCVNQALRGMVAFAYDMIGYNDAGQLPHGGTMPGEEDWLLGRFSLQLNNSVKALDFVSSLPYVDAARIGCTGCSGGGTQTYFLAALDERVTVAAPINMASVTMQGGCVCENTAGLRRKYCNMDYTMAIAPRPLFLAAADGDWTFRSQEVEFPAVQRIYDLYGASDAFEHFYQHAPHCYNRPVRERVYDFLCRRFGIANPTPDEVPFTMDTESLRVGDIRAHVPVQGFIDSDEKMMQTLTAIVKTNIAKMTTAEKTALTRFIFADDTAYDLDIPYYERDAFVRGGAALHFGACPSDADTCGAKYYHTYNDSDDVKRINALCRLLRSRPDLPTEADGKTAALLAAAKRLNGASETPTAEQLAQLRIPGLALWNEMGFPVL